MEKIKYAMIGFGGIAENRIAKEGFACDKSRFSPLANAELVGATDMNQARKGAAEALGLKWYATSEELLADPEIQAVFVATNNRTHAEIARKVMAAGKHVIVEKPIAVTVEDAEDLNRIAAEKNLSLTVDHMMVNNVRNVKARDMVKAGELGTVNDSCFHMEFAFGYDPAEAATWRCSDRGEMGGPVGDVASHCMYVAEFVFGEPIVKVAAVYYPKLMNIKAEDGAYIKFTFASGMTGSARVAFSELRGGLVGTLSNLGYEIYGDKAVLRGFGTMFQISGYEDEPIPVRLEIDRGKEQENVAVGEIKNIYQELIVHHADSIISGKPLNGEDAAHNLRLCAAVHESAANNGKVIEIKD